MCDFLAVFTAMALAPAEGGGRNAGAGIPAFAAKSKPQALVLSGGGEGLRTHEG